MISGCNPFLVPTSASIPPFTKASNVASNSVHLISASPVWAATAIAGVCVAFMASTLLFDEDSLPSQARLRSTEAVYYTY
jgi:hypothetical protein